MAIPFFLLVGELMTSANVVIRIAELSQALVGHIRGGLAQVTTVFSMFFSGMSGSSSADVAVLSRTMAKPMAQEGYRPAFTAALIAAASTIAALVPPSIMAVVYGAIGNVSIAGLFLGGIVPGLMIGFGLMIYCYFFGPAGFRRPRSTFRGLAKAASAAALPLFIPVILLGGIMTGWFTPTEAGVIAITYILLVVIPFLNRGHLKHVPRDFVHAGMIYSLPMITIAAASAFGWMLAYLRGPMVVSGWISGLSNNDPYRVMFLLVAGVRHRRRLHRAGAGDHHLHAGGERADRLGEHQCGAHGRGADRHPGVRPDHPALRPGAADGVEIHRRPLLGGVARVAADLCGFLRHHRLHHLLPGRHPVAAEARVSGIGRLLQVAHRRGLHLSVAIGRRPRPAGTRVIASASRDPRRVALRRAEEPIGRKETVRMATIRNPAREKLEQGRLSLGCGVRLTRSVEIGPAMKSAGFDWLFIDCEHGTMSLDAAAQIAVAALDAGIAPIVRVPNGEYSMATRVLDNGALGIVMPHVDSADEAAKVVQKLKYPPVGHRSMGGIGPHYSLRTAKSAEAASALNAANLTVVMLETPTAIANADAIARFRGWTCC